MTPFHLSGILSLVIVSFSCAAQPETPDWGVHFRDNGVKEVVLPFEIRSNLLLIPVRINGGPPMKFIFDTGAEHVVLLEKGFTPFLGMTITREIKVLGADLLEGIKAYLSPNVHLSFGPLVAKRQNLVVLDRNTLQLEAMLGVEVHGILGASLFRSYAIRIDFQRRQLVLRHKDYFRAPGGRYQKVPIEVVQQRPFVAVDMTIAPGDTLEDLRFLIDTGAGLTALVSAHTHERLDVPEQSILTYLGAGLGGQVSGYAGRTRWLRVGSFEFGDVVTSFQDIPDSLRWPVAVSRNGLIGNELLSRFDMWIDYVEECIYLRPVRKWQADFPYDRSGLVLVAGGPEFRQIVVSHVVEGSPADRAGMKRGDRLVSLNRIPTAWRRLSSVTRVLRKRIGKRIRIVVMRKGKRETMVFCLEKLI